MSGKNDQKIKPDPMTAEASSKDPEVVLGSIVIKCEPMITKVRLQTGANMAHNGDKPVRKLEISHAKKISQDLGIEGVLIIGIDKLPDGEFKGVSYGSDRLRCQSMALILDKICLGIMQGLGGDPSQ